jgi:glutathione S-transferase
MPNTPDILSQMAQMVPLNAQALKALGVATSLLCFKMFAVGITQGLVRAKNKVYTNPEDAALLAKGVKADAEHPNYLRASNAYRNDLENIPIFIGLAWAFLHLHCADALAPTYFAVFTAARFGHTFFYLKGLQPWRTISFGIGVLVNMAMAVQILLAALR